MVLIEERLSSETIYNGKIIDVYREMARLPNGEEAVRELVCHSGGVCIVPLSNRGGVNYVTMVKQFRYPFKEVLLEIPAGKLEPDEDHRAAGLRELSEETGATPKEFIYLGVTYPSVAYLDEKIHMYLATDLTFDKQNLDSDEFLDVYEIPFEDALKMVETG